MQASDSLRKVEGPEAHPEDRGTLLSPGQPPQGLHYPGLQQKICLGWSGGGVRCEVCRTWFLLPRRRLSIFPGMASHLCSPGGSPRAQYS